MIHFGCVLSNLYIHFDRLQKIRCPILLGVINSAVGAYYYLRIIVAMYMRDSRKPVPVSPVSLGLGTALAISIVATLYLGLVPDRVLQIAHIGPLSSLFFTAFQQLLSC